MSFFQKYALATCHTFCRTISSRSDEHDDHDDVDFDDEQEVFVSAVLSKYMETKSKRKVIGLTVDRFMWGFSPTELLPARTDFQHGYVSDESEEPDEFYSACDRLSRCSSETTAQAFLSMKTNLSRCSSMSSVEFALFRKRRSVIRELCRHCEGWPFGLCRKALLVPPLPKSPSESWLWRKNARLVKIA